MDAAPRIGPTFASLGVPAPLIAVLAQAGITGPFPIQAATLPDALAGTDILGRGRTGSGKTLGFSIPLAARLAAGHTSAGRPRGLVLVPTRELASQVHAVLLPLARAMGLTVATIFGGTGQNAQVFGRELVLTTGHARALAGQRAAHVAARALVPVVAGHAIFGRRGGHAGSRTVTSIDAIAQVTVAAG